MCLERKTLAVMVLAAVTALTACNQKGGGQSSNNSQNNNADAGTSADASSTNDAAVGNQLQLLPSRHARVRFKGGKRWADQLARGLHLNRSKMCLELGLYDCASQVHYIALGGVEPYRKAIYEPLKQSPITAPIAVNRIALSACSRRVENDLKTPSSAQIFKEMSADKPSQDDLKKMGNRLYQGLLSRDADEGELQEVASFWDEIAPTSSDPKRDWATMTCFAIATSTEMLFY